MQKRLDITYQNEYDHKAGAVFMYYTNDDVIMVESYDWLEKEIDFLSILRVEDIGKLRDFLNSVLES